ncbi:Transglutaminase-like superfamily protein [Rosistilla carotiformis]|uniref:Transglutaminase-like superfamily protein n=1 Tax=Rosistilla carotiformis TaxID=2528017 RepID=A0A518JWX9_9BACT|nr:transglutaminase-like domain-containing protein [Rosistilla carotiformis]QDV70060.1 Transglutaminase-like superfamily protein [Rosistilla carotiformis]
MTYPIHPRRQPQPRPTLGHDLRRSLGSTHAPLSRRSLLLVAAACCAPSAVGQETTATADDARLEFVAPEKQLWQVGVKVMTAGSLCEEIYATFPVPTEWPEQNVQVVDQSLSRYVDRWDTRDMLGGAKQVLVRMVNVPPNTASDALFTFEVTKSRIKNVGEINDLVIPQKVEREERVFLGSSPYIDPRHGKIRKIVNELPATDDQTPWQQVEQIYDWVRDHVEYREGEIKTAVEALDDGYGDCEELTSLFVAICRAKKIPARMVWIPGHCYPEFMLHDASGTPHWFPCQAAGTRQFGEMDEYKPILQKGDRFKVPEQKSVQRYVAEFCKVKARSKPDVTFVRELSDSE